MWINLKRLDSELAMMPTWGIMLEKNAASGVLWLELINVIEPWLMREGLHGAGL